jgi:hypothetical protein
MAARDKRPLPPATKGLFSTSGSILCWVDLLEGMLVCDLRTVCSSDLEFRFIPLPQHCPTYNVYDPQCDVDEFRSMACVGGTIKFVAMDGYVGHEPDHELELAVWTLSPDFSGWKKSRSDKYNVGNIWANETHQAIGTQESCPAFPVLSMREDNVVYLAFTDIRTVDNELDCRGDYWLRVDMEKNKVHFCPQSTDHMVLSQPFASEFSAYMQGVQDHPVLNH